MTDLVATVSEEKGALGHLSRVVDGQEWGNVLLFGRDFKNVFSKKVEFFALDSSKTLTELIDELTSLFKGKINDTEVAVNLICGSGKEHMAIVSAILKAGVGIRLVALTKEGVREV